MNYARHKLLENMLALLVVQGSQYVLPLLTFPYLVRVLGAEGFGLLGFTQVFCFYFIVVTDYGFNLTATRDVSVHRQSTTSLSPVISTVVITKGLLMVGSLIGASLLVAMVPPFRAVWPVFAASYLRVIGEALFPIWYFQGLERMKTITAFTILAKVWGVVAIFVWVHHPQDIVLAAVLQSSGSVMVGIIGCWWMVRDPLWRFEWVRWPKIRTQLQDGWPVFISQISFSLLSNTHTFVLGFFTDLGSLGLFMIAERIARALIGLAIPICAAIYPRVSSLFHHSQAQALTFLRTMILWGGLMFILLAMITYGMADRLIFYIGGMANPTSAFYLKCLSILPLLTFLNNIYGVQILLNIGRQQSYSRAYLVSGSVAILLSFIMVPHLKAVGTTGVMVFSDLLLLSIMIYTVYQAGISPSLHRRQSVHHPVNGI